MPTKKMECKLAALFGFLLLVMPLGLYGSIPGQERSQYVWCNAEGTGRQEVVFFRKNFDCTGSFKKAWIAIFADSRYHLYVNGTFVNFGPVRFQLVEPQYDSIDIGPYLRPGKNVIAIKVLSNGLETFQTPWSIGGLKVWGKIDGENVDFTTPGNWKCLKSKGYDQQALRFSFAQGAMEVYDTRNDPVHWREMNFDDSTWEKPIAIKDQKHWGKLVPRSIPFLTNNERTAFKVMNKFPLWEKEDLYSFRRKSPDMVIETDYKTSLRYFSHTYLYSPYDQNIQIGSFWGNHYLNGVKVERSKIQNPYNRVRINYMFPLKRGWNFLLMDLKCMWGGWEQYMSIPKEAGIQLSPNRLIGDDITFKSSLRLFSDKEDEEFERIKLELLKNRKLTNGLEWMEHRKRESANSPSREVIWRTPKEIKEYDTIVDIGAQMKISAPTGIVLDMGEKRLGRIFLDMDAPEGTLVDMAWSEILDDRGMPWIYKNHIINSGARWITGLEKSYYETFKPYGLRYLQIHITPPKGTMAILHKVGTMEQKYPMKSEGNFECSDPVMNSIWQMGWRTLQVCAEDSYTDTPFRERGHYAGDALPEFATTLATSGDVRLMHRSIELLTQMYHAEMWEGKHSRHEDFPLILILSLKWYTDYTKDFSLVKKYYPAYKSLLEHILAQKKEMGYMDLGRVFYEWTGIDHYDDLTGVQAMIAECLEIVAEWSEQLGEHGDGTHLLRESQKLKAVIQNHFWDREKGAFLDGFHEGEKIDHHYLTSTALPLLYESAALGQVGKALDFLENESEDIGETYHNRKTTPYGSFYLLASLYKHGRAGTAEKFIKKYWTRMLEFDNDTTWEHFDLVKADGTEGGTSSHAWSSHPTFFLSTETLGVSLGYYRDFPNHKIVIEPQSEHLSWARGTVPHPLGQVRVDWKIEGTLLRMQVKVPEGIRYEVNPKGRLAGYRLMINGDLMDSKPKNGME